MDAGKVVKGEGKPNDLMERIANDPLFKAVHDKLDDMIDPIIEAAKPMTDVLIPQCLRVKVLNGRLMPATTPHNEIARMTLTRLEKFLGNVI